MPHGEKTLDRRANALAGARWMDGLVRGCPGTLEWPDGREPVQSVKPLSSWTMNIAQRLVPIIGLVLIAVVGCGTLMSLHPNTLAADLLVFPAFVVIIASVCGALALAFGFFNKR